MDEEMSEPDKLCVYCVLFAPNAAEMTSSGRQYHTVAVGFNFKGSSTGSVSLMLVFMGEDVCAGWKTFDQPRFGPGLSEACTGETQ